MPRVIPRTLEIQGEIIAIRRDIHPHPELGFEEQRTSDLVAEARRMGPQVTRGIGGTGLVGHMRKGNWHAHRPACRHGRLPMEETNASSIARRTPAGCTPAATTATPPCCSAPRVLSEKRDFDGTVHLIFQPAEEGGGGGEAMIDDGLFEKFPCDAIFAIHNMPGMPLGHIVSAPGRCSPRPTAGTSASPAGAAMPRIRTSPRPDRGRAPAS